MSKDPPHVELRQTQFDIPDPKNDDPLQVLVGHDFRWGRVVLTIATGDRLSDGIHWRNTQTAVIDTAHARRAAALLTEAADKADAIRRGEHGRPWGNKP